MATVFLGKVEQGQIDFGSRENLARWNDWKKRNNGVQVRIEPVKKVRSLQQNRYYWAYLNIIERETGNDSEFLHEIFRRKFIRPKFMKYKGKEIKLPGSTTELSKLEFGEYLDKICAETEIALPNPKDLEALGYILN